MSSFKTCSSFRHLNTSTLVRKGYLEGYFCSVYFAMILDADGAYRSKEGFEHVSGTAPLRHMDFQSASSYPHTPS